MHISHLDAASGVHDPAFQGFQGANLGGAVQTILLNHPLPSQLKMHFFLERTDRTKALARYATLVRKHGVGTCTTARIC